MENYQRIEQNRNEYNGRRGKVIKTARSRFIGIPKQKHSQFSDFISYFYSSRKKYKPLF